MGQTHKLSKKSKLGSNKADRLLKKGSKVTFFGPTKSDPVLARGGSNFFFKLFSSSRFWGKSKS